MSDAATNQTNLNKVILYHEIQTEKVDQVLKSGLFRNKPGDKEDSPIIKTNKLIDSVIPKALADKGISRIEVAYLYYAKDGEITNIEDGEKVIVEDFPLGEDQALLEVSISSEECYISNLDQFDYIKWLVTNNELGQAKEEAKLYWDAIIPLSEYDDSIERPEVIVTTNIDPSDLKLIRKNDSS